MADQPPGSTWIPRTDAGARKLIERIDGLSSKIEATNVRMGDFVTHAKLYLTIGTAAGLVVGAAWYVSKANADEGRADIVSFKDSHNHELKSIHENAKQTAARFEANTLRIEGKIDRVLERMSRQRRATISAGDEQ